MANSYFHEVVFYILIVLFYFFLICYFILSYRYFSISTLERTNLKGTLTGVLTHMMLSMGNMHRCGIHHYAPSDYHFNCLVKFAACSYSNIFNLFLVFINFDIVHLFLPQNLRMIWFINSVWLTRLLVTLYWMLGVFILGLFS